MSVGSCVPYLAFADDMIIFTRCSSEALTSIQEFLLLYQSYLGQKVNMGKSSFSALSRKVEYYLDMVRSTLGFTEQ